MSKINRTKDCERKSGRRSASAKAALTALATLALAAAPHSASADARSQAKRMYDRLTGTPPSPALLDTLTTKLTNEGAVATAMYIVDPSQAHSSDFYRVTLKNFATPWTNRDRNVFAPLNDYTATVIGMVRDDKDFRGLLSDDILYVGAAGSYSPTSNAMYEDLESTNADLRLKSVLAETMQSSVTGIPATATAGIITSRAAAQAFFIAGTNRAMFRFTMLNHLCRDMEQILDTTRPPDRIRQDVSRSPGGDSSVFLNNCIGCHDVMDSMAQAFAYYNYDETAGRLVYTPGQVQPKYLINSDNFKPGYVTPDDAWENRMRLPGQNTALGWEGQDDQVRGGNGAKSLGQELAHSRAFAQCQVEKVFRNVCFRSPNTADQTAVKDMTDEFIGSSNGNMKRVFAETAAYCAGN
ncbi:MAG TPA: hypothetical protein VFS47_07985 [Steroidobacteraceae bacterium]|nr:hypothetical protein [Steroidobacteraceae bacterium]